MVHILALHILTPLKYILQETTTKSYLIGI